MADKALIMGINNYKLVSHLQGCINDTETMNELLVDVFNFPSGNIRVLRNDQVVKSEVLRQLDWLFQDVNRGDRVVVHFSGHGSYVEDKDGDEPDGRDELIALHDMDFADPETYLTDDEIKEWTRTKPEGVRLTVVLDNCNSGTGTRMLMNPLAANSPQRTEIDPGATVKRSLSTASPRAGLEAANVAASALERNNPNIVRVRFIDPPQIIKDRVNEAATRGMTARGFVKVRGLNHVLISACRADQTAADATINGKPAGAFTYYLDQVLRTGGSSMQRTELIDRLGGALQSAHFSQLPQLEGPGNGPLFGGQERGALHAHSKSSNGHRNDSEAWLSAQVNLAELLDKLAPLDVETRKRVLDLYEGRSRTRKQGGFAERDATGTAQRRLVLVHGICSHPPGFSNEWWNSLHPHTTAFGNGDLGQSRMEVLWSDLVNERGLRNRALDDRKLALRDEIRDTLQDRIDRHMIESGQRALVGGAPRALSDSRSLISIPGLNCLDDFMVYLTDDAIRASILRRFTDVVRPLLQSNAELDIISHSWGTVVAYEGLRELADNDRLTSVRVRNLFTVGAALSISPVKTRLRPSNRDGSKPAMVRRWVNLNAHGDPVGGPLQGRPYSVDFDFPNLDPVGCSSFLGIINPSCAHGSYFKRDNLAVNRDIFAHFIDAQP